MMKNSENRSDLLSKTAESLKKENLDLGHRYTRLCDIIGGCESAIVAFSGGVDSSLLAFLSHDLLDRSLCVTADSPTLPRSELEEAVQFARKYNLNHRIITHNELDDERFAKNDERRCFFCKDGLFGILKEIKERENYNFVFDGSNFDDLDDYRPGREAAKKNGVRSPLLEAEVGKEDIREISRVLGLPTWDKAQMACLSSRFPRDTPISLDDLGRIEKAEELLKDLGYKDVRVRFHGELAKIELGKDEKVILAELRSLIPGFKELGFKFVTLDLEGFRSGSLNE